MIYTFLFEKLTGFLRTVLNLLDSGMARGYLKHLTELFRFLYDFAKLGDEEAKFFLSINTITTFVEFYLKAIRQSPEGGHIDLVSDEDDEDDDDIVALTPMTESNRLASLEKMIWLLVILVEKSRGEDNQIHLSNSDLMVLTGKASLVTTSGSPSAAATATTATSSSATAASTTTTATSASSTSPPSTCMYILLFILCHNIGSYLQFFQIVIYIHSNNHIGNNNNTFFQ